MSKTWVKTGAVRRFGFVAGSLVALAGCGIGGEPYMLGRVQQGDNTKYEVGLLPAGNDPATGRPFFSLCYNRLNHKPEQIRALVQKHCSDAQLFYNQADLYSCSLSAPVRATYSCGALSRTAEETRPNLGTTNSYLGAIQLY